MDVWMDRWVDGRIDGWVGDWVGMWVGGSSSSSSPSLSASSSSWSASLRPVAVLPSGFFLLPSWPTAMLMSRMPFTPLSWRNTAPPSWRKTAPLSRTGACFDPPQNNDIRYWGMSSGAASFIDNPSGNLATRVPYPTTQIQTVMMMVIVFV